MMKNTIFGPLLLLLTLAVTIRNSYANPTSVLENSAADLVADVVHQVNTLHLGNSIEILNTMTSNLNSILESPIAKSVMEIADHLTKVVLYLKDKIGHTYYDEAIRQLEIDVDNLPSDLNEDRKKMLLRLYRSNTRIITTRVNLEQAARQLESYCQELIDIYENNDPNMRTLKYTAKKFNEYATFVIKLLKKALVTYAETQDELSEARASLKDFHYKLSAKKRELTGNRKKRALGDRNKRAIGDRNKRAISVLTAIAIGVGAALAAGAIAVGVTIALTQKDYDNLVDRIENVQITLDQLFIENTNMQTYVSQEIVLITDWEVKLEASLLDNHHEFSEDDIFFAIKHIKNRLIALKNACTEYLSHKLPDILQNVDKKKN